MPTQINNTLGSNLTPNQSRQPVLLNWTMRPLLANPYVAAHRQNYNSVIQLHTVTHTLYCGGLDIVPINARTRQCGRNPQASVTSYTM